MASSEGLLPLKHINLSLLWLLKLVKTRWIKQKEEKQISIFSLKLTGRSFLSGLIFLPKN